MLTAKLYGISRVAWISVIIAAASGGYLLQEGRIAGLSSELADRSQTIELRSQEIQQYSAMLAAQEREIEDKTSQLEDLNAQIEVLAAAIISREAEVAGLDTTVALQEIELRVLQSRAADLQQEIELLKDQVRSGEQHISELEGQVSAVQAQLDSTKRLRVSHFGVAVDKDGIGTVFPIEVEVIRAGDGTISLDVRNVQYEATFQTAVRAAATVASAYTGISVDDKDIIVRFINDSEDEIIKVDGPSAGALVTAMIIAALEEKETDPSVLVTGSIGLDGKIGAVGSISSKMDAAIDFGATTILVPKSQQIVDERIEVIGVTNIDQVIGYLIKQ